MSGLRAESHWASTGVESLCLTVRAYNCLRNAGIESLGELVKKTPTELLSIRGLGRETLQVIQEELAARGLRLGMQDIDLRTFESIDAFLQAMDIVRDHGVTGVAELVTKTPQELAALPGIDAAAVRNIEACLTKWNLSLGMRSASEHPTSQASPGDSIGGCPTSLDQRPSLHESVPDSSKVAEATVVPFGIRGLVDKSTADRTSRHCDVQRDSPQTVKDELLCAIAYLLAGSKSSRFCCFAAYHGIEGFARRSLEEIGAGGLEHGFRKPVTRERVRQLVARAEKVLRCSATRTKFAHWQSAVLATHELIPTRVAHAVDAFGYGSCEEPVSVFAMLSLVADIFSLDFPFVVRKIRGVDIVLDRSSGSVGTINIVHGLTNASGDSYYETTVQAERVGCEVDALEKVIAGGLGWEFLDEAQRYFWKTPRLPPRNYAVTGNAILTALCKVFSVAREATVVDLAAAISRERGVRKKVPQEVVEGIAVRSGLFDLEQGVLRKKAGQAWFCLRERDMGLLQACLEHGRVISSQTLRSSLVRRGLTSENAAVVIACNPFLVHTKAGRFLDEGVYKLVCHTDDVATAVRERMGANGVAAEPHPDSIAADCTVRITVSPRVRLSGVHFAPEPIGMDGEWRVRGADGTFIGVVTLSGRLVKGLCAVVEALGLGTNAVLELRRHDGADLVAVRV